MPFFSVIIPTYNRADYVAEAVRSVLAQDDQDFEVIVVDDGSTDNTEESLKPLMESGKVVYLWQENQERGAARNTGIAAAAGQFIVFLDCDDLMEPIHLSTLRRVIEANPNTDTFATHYRFFDDFRQYDAPVSQVSKGLHDINVLLEGNHFACHFAVRNKERMPLFRESRDFSGMEDWLFLLAHVERGPMYVEDDATIRMREHEGRSMKNDHARIINNRLKANQWALENIQLSEKQKKTMTAYSYYFTAIHHYLDHNTKAARADIARAAKGIGMKWKFFLLRLKLMLGWRPAQTLKHE